METLTSAFQLELQHKIDNKTKPIGSLGMLEDIAARIATIQNTLTPTIMRPHIAVFAGDHGIAATGLVNPYPQAVTAQMVLNFLRGGAAINVFCRQHQVALKVIDAGVNYDFHNDYSDKQFADAKIGYGTKNYLEEEAMSEQQVLQAIKNGKEIVKEIAQEGCNMIGFGEMGIGNTSSASLIMSAITGEPVSACVGKGTGTSEGQLKTKTQTLEAVYQKHRLWLLENEPVHLLKCIGGFEIAMMTGAFLQAAESGMIVLADGFIATSALMVALKIDPSVGKNCLFAHASGEQGHEKMLHYLQATPLLRLGMRLGEGTGAALAIPLVQSAVNFLNEMASFESAGVSEKSI